MKAFQKYLMPIWLALFVFAAAARADELGDLKADVAIALPVGTHQDRVRQFLKVRRFKITELPKEKSLAARRETKRGFKVVSVIAAVFEFDDAWLLKNVRYEQPSPRS